MISIESKIVPILQYYKYNKKNTTFMGLLM